MIHLFPSRTVAISFGSFAIHWYGLMYLLGFMLAYLLLPRLQKYRGIALRHDDWASFLSYAVLGVLVGGRLGYVFFYEPSYFLQYPLQIVAVWQGGMSSHGGFLGVVIAMLFALRSRAIHKLAFADTVVVPVALGLAFGRVGNLINGELYGTVTDLPWAMAFPGVEGLRHPTQIYAIVKDLLIAGVCFWSLRSAFASARPGMTTAIFLMLYAVLRFTVEFYRAQEYAGMLGLTRGQFLTVPVFLAGIVLLRWSFYWRGIAKRDL